MEKYNIKLEYEHNWVDHPLTVTTKVNDRIINLDISGKNNVVIEKTISLSEDSHQLQILIDNKNEANTQVDENGNILADTTVELKSIQINEIELMPLVYHQEEFAGFYINGNENEQIKKIVNFGYNGVWKFNFKTPVYDWILEHLF